MALHTLALARSNVLDAVTFASPNVLAAADRAAIGGSIINDLYATIATGGGVITTGDTHTSTLVDNLAAGQAAKVQVRQQVCGQGILPNTFVIAKPTATSITLSQAASATAATVALLFVPINNGEEVRFSDSGIVRIPRRGWLQLYPGDVVATDRITGFPIVVSAAAIAASGSWWTYT